jgi:hypothetical protein
MDKSADINYLPSYVKQYLDKYSLPLWTTELSAYNKFSGVIVIPALAEFENIKNLLSSLSQNQPDYFNDVLILFVINNSPLEKDEFKYDNSFSLQLLRDIINKRNKEDNFINEIISSGLNIGLIDASSEGNELPSKDAGAGLARKIGMDAALTFINYQEISNPFIVCLDADCKVSKNYLTELINSFLKKNTTSAFINFEHTPEGSSEQRSALICYENYLRYYVLSLKLAGSHFAFHTIGSTMACSCSNYIKAGGMNKRKAGEDFYFMEKLGKISDVEYIKNTTVYPSSRTSWRVPFGTGQRINRFLSGIQNEYMLYSFDSFLILKEWLTVFNDPDRIEAQELLSEAGNINPSLYNFLLENNFEYSWEKILRNSKTKEQVNKQKLFWFDGFRTLKLIHFLRDNGFQMMPMFDALDNLFNYYKFTKPAEKREAIPPVNVQNEYLSGLRTLEFLVL